MNPITIEHIKQAKQRIEEYINYTPILSSSLLDEWLGHEILFKAEGFQKIGAFKARGACNTIAWLVENGQKPESIVANSSGNHAQAVAWAASLFDIPATIYMPEFSSKIKIQATQAYGAEVVLCKTRNEADQNTKDAVSETDAYWIPPFNHKQVIAGQGTVAYDAIQQVGEVDAVFAPCGGGGLLSGTLIATQALLPKAKVIGAEPLNANDAAESLRKGAIQRLSQTPDTLADGAMTMAVGDITFEYLKQLAEFYEIEEEKIIYWTQWLNHLLKNHIEPTSAMAMEAAKRWLQKQKSPKRVLVILSGGNVDQETNLKVWEKDMLGEMPRL